MKFQNINRKSVSYASTYDEDKAEIRTECSIKGTSYCGHQYIAISPDGTQIATLNTSNHQIKLCQFKDLSVLWEIDCEEFKNFEEPSEEVNWSLSVSNQFVLDDGNVDVLIAVSCFDDDCDMRYYHTSRHQSQNENKSSTWIISVTNQSRIPTPINNIGGIISFLNNKAHDLTEIVLINIQGITKYLINHKEIKNTTYNQDNNGWFNFFFSDKSIETFDFPEKYFIEMKRISDNRTCNTFIQQSLVKGRLIVEDYKDQVQTVEMYNLKTNLLENTFQKYEESVIRIGSPSFAISNNESLFAYCRGANNITIYLMENGLEVTTKKFQEKNIQILFFDFVQDDSKLLIVIEKGQYNEDTAEIDFTPNIVIWDLFICSDNCVRRANDNFSLFPTKHEYPQRLVNSFGNIITITEDGIIISIFKEPKIIKLINPESNISTRNLIISDKDNPIIDPSLSCMDDYLIYNYSGERLYSQSKDNIGIIIKNPEPWVQNKNYGRILVYLNDCRTIQLIIGKSTVQIWRRIKGVPSSTKVLEYIWVNKYTENHRQFQIQHLEVGHENFSITLYIPSGITPKSGNNIKLEWPEKVNNTVDACQALEFLEKIKNVNSNPKKQFQFKNLIQQTESIVTNCFIKRCGLWRMLDIRFDIMANLIRGNCVSIIRKILSSKSINGKNRYLHIPRCYSWNKQIKETDLEIAIKCAEKGYQKDTIIVKYLLDYYSDNATKTSNWMFTVSKAIPFLYKYHLEFYIKELFQKPCFGTNEIYLEKSSLDTGNIIKCNNKNIQALNINMGLVKRKEFSSLFKKLIFKYYYVKASNIMRTNPPNQVYMVPLPDFIVYPEGINDKRDELWKIPLKLLKMLVWPRGHIIEKEEKMSPFLRMIRSEDRAEIFDNPSIAAIIDFKWNTARGYYLRQIFLYIMFALAYGLRAEDVLRLYSKLGLSESANSFYVYIIKLCYGRRLLLYWIGFYLLNIERIQIMHNGLKRYLSFYNFFDVFSVILPIIIVSIQEYYKITFLVNGEEKDYNDKVYIVDALYKSFAILIISMEFLLVSLCIVYLLY
jgi:hypothetical protein